MTLLLTMLPIYVMGNLHCLGMCGPIALWISHSPYRAFYLAGRLISFTLAGTVAGALGEVIGALLSTYRLSGLFSLTMGLGMIAGGISIAFGHAFPFAAQLAKRGSKVQEFLQKWLYINAPWQLLVFGFLTIALPCGQTLLVYSACALSGSAAVGTLNGFVFGALTTPALLLAMRARSFILKARSWYEPVVSISASVVGIIACLRGLAELSMIPHVGVHPFILY